MSEYCKTKAPEKFYELIKNINSKYIAVSYNNTYKSKSSSSKNKITLEQIESTLEKKGRTKIFKKSHITILMQVKPILMTIKNIFLLQKYENR